MVRALETAREYAGRRGARRPRVGSALLPYLFVAPAVITLLVLVAYPIVRVIEISFFNVNLTASTLQWVGLGNYGDIAREQLFWISLQNSAVFTVFSVLLHLSFGLGLALLLNRRFNAGLRAVFRGLFILPWLFIPVIVAIIWALILHPAGAVNSTLHSLGLLRGTPIDWFSDFTWAMPSLVVANSWAGYPFSMLMILAGLQAIPNDLYEAASVDGAGCWQRFRNVTLPGLGPTIMTIALLDSIWTFRLWDLPYLLTGGGPINSTLVLPLYTYQLAFEGFRFGQSAAVAVIILVVTLVFSFLYLRYRAKLLEST